MMDSISLIGFTLNFRDFQRTCNCVTALLNEGASHVLIWDNSEDGGGCAELLAECWQNEERVTILVSPVNVGFGAAVNRGIQWINERFKYPFVALINNDALFLPGALSLLASALMADSNALIAYPKISHNGNVLGTVYYQPWLGIFASRRLPGSIPYASGCAMVVALERFEGPLFDEAFFMYGEDIELGWRFSNKRGALLHVPKLLVEHIGSASSGMATEFYESRMVAAHFILARKLSKHLVCQLALILIRVGTLASRSVIRSVRYRSLIPAFSLVNGWNLAFRKDVLKKRAQASLVSNQLYALSSDDSRTPLVIDQANSTVIPSMQGIATSGDTL